MAERPLLEVEGLRKTFGGVRAVAGIRFALTRGDIRAVIGPNGAGKTTLFNLLSGQLSCDEGSIRFDGERIDGLPPRAHLAQGDQPHLPSSRDLCLSHAARERPDRPAVQTGKESGDVYGGGGVAAEPGDGAAGSRGVVRAGRRGLWDSLPGRSEAVGIGACVGGRADAFVAGRAHGGHVGRRARRVIDLVGRIVREREITVLFTEHDMDVVFSIASGILVMHQGRILIDGPPATVREDPEVQRVYLGEGA